MLKKIKTIEPKQIPISEGKKISNKVVQYQSNSKEFHYSTTIFPTVKKKKKKRDANIYIYIIYTLYNNQKWRQIRVMKTHYIM